jgi:hypothetical protein
MRPWRGARRGACLAIVVLAAAAPGAASAADGTALVTFKLPNAGAVDTLNDLGADLAESVRPGPGGSVFVDAVVTPSEQARLEALGYQAVGTIQDDAAYAAVKAERNAAIADEQAALANVRAGGATGKARSLAADKVQAQRADYFENYAGRFLSIEGYTSDQHVTCAQGPNGETCAYDGPALTGAWLDAGGNVLGSAVLSPFVDDRQYLYHTLLVRVGDLNDGKPMPATVRVASADGGVDTLPVKPWVSKDGKGFPATFQKDFNTHYVDPQEGYKRIRDLAAAYPNISQIYDLPNKTTGYQRKSQAIVGTVTPYTGSTTSDTRNNIIGGLNAANQAQAVVLTTLAWGQDGGNDVTVALVKPSGNGAPLGVSVAGKAITVSLATDAAGAVTSTAKQVVDAINASAEASQLVTATTFRATGGTGVVAPTATTKLTDYLKAPDTYPRGPQTVNMIRIGSHRDGSKTGVFVYCQEHAREWATPLVCLETAERLLRNYGTDPETTELVDNLDIFIIPTINADGAAYSMYDFTSQRKNMVNYCAGKPGQPSDPVGRNSWGVDINRNFSVGSVFDGYEGASSTSCTSGTFAGPAEFSEPESRNEQFVQSTFQNIKFAMNVHSYGGYFMWPPGAYKTDGRVTLDYPPYGTLQYFDQTAAGVLDRIKSYRGTAILPSRTGPVADVLYSAAGNSADEAYYNHGIIGYDFEVGADRFTGTGTAQTEVGFTPPYANEGHDEGMEFAHGNYALLDSALDYDRDTTGPVVTAVGPDVWPSSFDVTFSQNEAAEIHYTTDGSEPTLASPVYAPSHPRGRPEPIHIAGTTTLRWIAKDFKGNTSSGSRVFKVGDDGDVSGTVPATLTLSLGPAPAFGSFVPGVSRTYLAHSTATATSTAGNATLTVADTTGDRPGRLVNGAFALKLGLQAQASSPKGAGAGYGSVGANPLTLLTYAGPVTNDPITLDFRQSVGATEGLRTGSYSKTLTFTLSTTQP